MDLPISTFLIILIVVRQKSQFFVFRLLTSVWWCLIVFEWKCTAVSILSNLSSIIISFARGSVRVSDANSETSKWTFSPEKTFSWTNQPERNIKHSSEKLMESATLRFIILFFDIWMRRNCSRMTSNSPKKWRIYDSSEYLKKWMPKNAWYLKLLWILRTNIVPGETVSEHPECGKIDL
jgi:hypothetical protein